MTQNLTGSTTSVFTAGTNTLTKGQGDDFGSRYVLSGESGTQTFDLSAFTMEGSEPNPNTATKTGWAEIVVLGDMPTKIRVAATGGAGTVLLAVFKSVTADVDNNIDPTLATLTSVASGSADITFNTDDTADSYYVQVGLTAGAGTGWTLSFNYADPIEGASFASRVTIDAEEGFDQEDSLTGVLETGEPIPSGITPVRKVMWTWTCPTPSPGVMTFYAESNQTTGSFSIAAYTGTAVNALTQVSGAAQVVSAGSRAQIQFTPTAGVVYTLQFTTTVFDVSVDIGWYGPSASIVSVDPVAHLRAEVWNRLGTTKITELPRRNGIQFQERLNEPGSGSIAVHAQDELLAAYPTMLNTGNIIKFYLGSTCVSGFRIKELNSSLVSEGENAGLWFSASGPTVMDALRDFIIKHDTDPPTKDAPDVRYYSWASQPGVWYNAGDWTDQYNCNTQKDPPGGKPGTLAVNRPKFGYPTAWKDPKALWMWISPKSSQNEGGYTPPRAMHGLHYYRKTFRVMRNGTHVRLYCSADSIFKVYLDGNVVISKKGTETGYKTYVTYDVVLRAGIHTIGLFMESLNSMNIGDRNEAILFTAMKLNSKGVPKDVLIRSGRNWKAFHGFNPPGWNHAMVMMNAVNEASARGVATATAMGFDFTTSTDTAGKPWSWRVNKFTQEVGIGITALELAAMFSESEDCDITIDPATMKVQMWRFRGKDKSRSVALVIGSNLMDWATTTTDEVVNTFLVRYDGGWFTVQNNASVHAYGKREGYVELGGVKDRNVAKNIMDQVMTKISSENRWAGTPEVILKRSDQSTGGMIAVRGAFPFLDFGIGDIISAPDKYGNLQRYRVMSITCSEDDDGNLTFDPELQEWNGLL